MPPVLSCKPCIASGSDHAITIVHIISLYVPLLAFHQLSCHVRCIAIMPIVFGQVYRLEIYSVLYTTLSAVSFRASWCRLCRVTFFYPGLEESGVTISNSENCPAPMPPIIILLIIIPLLLKEGAFWWNKVCNCSCAHRNKTSLALKTMSFIVTVPTWRY